MYLWLFDGNIYYNVSKFGSSKTKNSQHGNNMTMTLYYDIYYLCPLIIIKTNF